MGTKISAYSNISVPDFSDYLLGNNDTGPTTGTFLMDRLFGLGGFIPGGRLTLTSGTAVTTADVTGAGTLYYTPYLHNRIRIYDGTRWRYYAFSELSLSLTLTSGKPYDVWVYDNSGTLTLEVLVWTNDTTRATALTTQDGVSVKTGATTRLYLGSIYASGANTTEDSALKRYVWNQYNRVVKPLAVFETTDSWTYNSGTYRQANNSAANQIDMMCGVAGGSSVNLLLNAFANPGTANDGSVAIGLDGTSGGVTGSIIGYTPSLTGALNSTAHYTGMVPVGRHYFTWLEHLLTITTSITFYGDAGIPASLQSGLIGTVDV